MSPPLTAVLFDADGTLGAGAAEIYEGPAELLASLPESILGRPPVGAGRARYGCEDD
jgi:hypothetical protein